MMISVLITLYVCVLGGRQNIHTARDTAVFFIWLKTPCDLWDAAAKKCGSALPAASVSKVFSLSIVNIKIHISSKKVKW